jgi:hypothetical protein
MNGDKSIFPCKSVNLVRWLKTQNIYSVHKYKDIEDYKDCWLFIVDDDLTKALLKWKIEKPT